MGMLLSTGMIMWHAENAQDVFDMILKAYVIAEKTDVHLPIGIFMDGFFVTHAREKVELIPEDVKLPPYDPDLAPVPAFDMEHPPIRHVRDPLLNKSNFISYMANASWHQEVIAASDRARKYIKHLLGGLLEIENEEAKFFIAASGTAVAQSREAIKVLRKEGIDIGLLKIKSIRPFPKEEIIAATANAEVIIVPEFNAEGWLAREIKATLDSNSRVIDAPRVFGGMTMPVELIVNTVKEAIKNRTRS